MILFTNTIWFFCFFQGTIASMFDNNTKLGKLFYVFDIERTCREVHDHARRMLHSRGVDIKRRSGMKELTNGMKSLTTDDDKCQLDKEVTNRIAEAFTCRVCMDSPIDTAFYPCGHVACCDVCADK